MRVATFFGGSGLARQHCNQRRLPLHSPFAVSIAHRSLFKAALSVSVFLAAHPASCGRAAAERNHRDFRASEVENLLHTVLTFGNAAFRRRGAPLGQPKLRSRSAPGGSRPRPGSSPARDLLSRLQAFISAFRERGEYWRGYSLLMLMIRARERQPAIGSIVTASILPRCSTGRSPP